MDGANNLVLKNRTLLDIIAKKDREFILHFFSMLMSHPDLAGFSELVEKFDSTIKSLPPSRSAKSTTPGERKSMHFYIIRCYCRQFI